MNRLSPQQNFSSVIFNIFFLPKGVQYYTGQFFDLKRITEAGHKKVILLFLDLKLSQKIFIGLIHWCKKAELSCFVRSNRMQQYAVIS